MALDAIKNFIRVDDRLATAGQPTADQLHEVAAAGFQLVVNLGLLDPRYCLPDEAALVRELGMDYEHLPVHFDAPRIEDFERFVSVMDAQRERTLFVHCAANYRVSAFVALYGELRWQWSREHADAHVARVWAPDEAWRSFIAAVRERQPLL
jgi:protein tyrosine phosphatase (PTP) superfamily phosphohydrolase (DUF442 family)